MRAANLTLRNAAIELASIERGEHDAIANAIEREEGNAIRVKLMELSAQFRVPLPESVAIAPLPGLTLAADPSAHPIDESIELFRMGFKALGIPERDLRVTWDSEARWARLRMRLPSGAIVEKVERPAADEPLEDALWRLTQYLHRGAKAVEGGATHDTVFVADILSKGKG